ncbi:hypothetical protein AAVH_27424 [Aphelenchoides avenae]|nr:hypothetical protein AAVH_27424 [Aphelenchus avenae]
MNQPLHEMMLSLQRLTQVVLPEMKRVSSVILASASDVGIAQAATLESLIHDAHRIAGAAVRGFAHVVKEDRANADSGSIKSRKSALSLDVELEVLRYCSRVDLDKLQLVSKGKRMIVDNMSARLALHKVCHVEVEADADNKCCIVTYSTALYLEEESTNVREVILLNGSNQNGLVSLNTSPLRRLRNAFVGAIDFDPPKHFTAKFMELMSDFVRRDKGAMQVGILRLCYAMNAQWITYLLGAAADDLNAKCFVVSDYSKRGNTSFIDRILAAPTLRKARRITMDTHCKHKLGAPQLASLVELATNCGDVRRIDILLGNDHFAECLTQWIQAMLNQQKVAKAVNNVLFHCEGDTVLPAVLGEPVARLSKRKWPTMTYDGEACEMVDVEEKSVFVLDNESLSTDVTVVVAWYQYDNKIHSGTSVSCKFLMNPTENLDIGDFSAQHVESVGVHWQLLTDFD